MKTLRGVLFEGYPGCSNHDCIITGPKKGFGTNGQCHCMRHLLENKVATSTFLGRLRKVLDTDAEGV